MNLQIVPALTKSSAVDKKHIRKVIPHYNSEKLHRKTNKHYILFIHFSQTCGLPVILQKYTLNICPNHKKRFFFINIKSECNFRLYFFFLILTF